MNRAEAGRLLTRYLDGELSPDERRQLMDAILSDQDLYNAFAEELILAEMLEDTGFRAKVNAAVQPAPGVKERIVGFFRNLNASWRVAIMPAAAALVLVSSVLLYRAKHHEEGVVARGGVPLSPDTAHLHLAGMDAAHILDRYKKRLMLADYKDAKRGNGGFLQNIYDLGDGEVDFPACHRVLKAASFKSWLIVDLDVARKGPRVSYLRCGAYVVNTLESIYV